MVPVHVNGSFKTYGNNVQKSCTFFMFMMEWYRNSVHLLSGLDWIVPKSMHICRLSSMWFEKCTEFLYICIVPKVEQRFGACALLIVSTKANWYTIGYTCVRTYTFVDRIRTFGIRSMKNMYERTRYLADRIPMVSTFWKMCTCVHDIWQIVYQWYPLFEKCVRAYTKFRFSMNLFSIKHRGVLNETVTSQDESFTLI
jgi:hypothetical protein